MTKSYIHIYQETKQRILQGHLKPGMKLPAHRELCDDYSVAIATVTKAINKLKQDGLVQSCRGVGTVVADPALAISQTVTKTVMFISPYQNFMHEAFSFAIHEVFDGSEWSVNTRCAHSNLEWYKNFLVDCHKNPPAGMILVAMPPQIFPYKPQMLPQPGTKMVLMVHEIPGRTYDLVRSDAYAEGLILGDYIANKGYRDIIYLTQNNPGVVPESKTLKGLEKRLSERGITFNQGNIRRYEDTHSYGIHPDPVTDAYLCTRNLLADERPRAIVTGHDWIGVGVIRAVQEAGLSVPGDIAVISAETTVGIEARTSIPKLTTFDTVYYHRARTAGELLKSRLEGDDSPVQYHEIHGHLVEGETG